MAAITADDLAKITHGLAVRCLALEAMYSYQRGTPHEDVTRELQELSGGHLSTFLTEIVTHDELTGREKRRQWMAPPVKFTIEIAVPR